MAANSGRPESFVCLFSLSVLSYFPAVSHILSM